MEIKLVASDLDGTLIDQNNHVPNENLEALEEIKNKNIQFAICTGKSYSVSQNICKNLKASYGIFGNGAQVIDFHTGKEIFRNTLKEQDAIRVIQEANKQNFHVHFYTENSLITEKLLYLDLRNFYIRDQNSSFLKIEIVSNLESFIKSRHPNIFNLVVSSESPLDNFQKKLSKNNKNITLNLIQKTGEYKDRIINKEYEYLSISSSNISKSNAVKFLSQYLNINTENVLSIGDNRNDLEMVKNSGIGVAVHDSYDELKKVAKYTTTKSASDGAFAEAIFKYIK